MARSRADGLSEALKLLEKVHGRVLFARGSPMDLVMGLLLSRDAPEERATDALRRLSSEFVDWNEVRISYRREVSGVLAAAGYPDVNARAETILALLGGLYRDKNGVDLAFLEKMESAAVYQYFRSYPQVGEAIAATLAASLREDGMILDIPEIVRTAQRIGLGGARTTPAKTRKFLEEKARGADRLKAHYYLALHATTGPCRARSPQCAVCGVGPGCATGRAAARTGGRSRKPADPPADAGARTAGAAARPGRKTAATTVKKPAKGAGGRATPAGEKTGRARPAAAAPKKASPAARRKR